MTRTAFVIQRLASAEEQGKLRYAGRVSSGLTDLMRVQLLQVFAEVHCQYCPLEPDGRERRARWVEPRLVAEVRYMELIGRGAMRPSWDAAISRHGTACAGRGRANDILVYRSGTGVRLCAGTSP